MLLQSSTLFLHSFIAFPGQNLAVSQTVKFAAAYYKEVRTIPGATHTGVVKDIFRLVMMPSLERYLNQNENGTQIHALSKTYHQLNFNITGFWQQPDAQFNSRYILGAYMYCTTACHGNFGPVNTSVLGTIIIMYVEMYTSLICMYMISEYTDMSILCTSNICTNVYIASASDSQSKLGKQNQLPVLLTQEQISGMREQQCNKVVCQLVRTSALPHFQIFNKAHRLTNHTLRREGKGLVMLKLQVIAKEQTCRLYSQATSSWDCLISTTCISPTHISPIVFSLHITMAITEKSVWVIFLS